jgi:phosphomannomutase
MANGCHLSAALDADGDCLAVADECGQAVAPDTLAAYWLWRCTNSVTACIAF